ncbi:hypothetical protein Bbelb_049620 [Branchiostoma belcheri]|nr:hypothetical protein Bbelb_049620 [Branchiostoma belcheri]
MTIDCPCDVMMISLNNHGLLQLSFLAGFTAHIITLFCEDPSMEGYHNRPMAPCGYQEPELKGELHLMLHSTKQVLKKRGKSTCVTDGFVQPAPSLDKFGLLGELSAHSPDEHNKTRVFLVNESTEPVIMSKGTVIGTFNSVENGLPSCGTLTVAATTSFELESPPPRVDSLRNTPLARSSDEIRAELEPLFDFSHISDRSHKEQLLDPLVKRRRRLDKLARLGFIEESISPWGAPVVLVNKKDGTKRMCVDYRGLNNVTKKSSWPLPRIDDNIDALSGSQLFSTLDLRSAYMQVPLQESAREKTAFSTPLGLFQYKRIPFGLCSAPSTFARLMENVLRGLQPHMCLAYLDDNIVHSDEVIANHLAHLEAVFQRYREANSWSPKWSSSTTSFLARACVPTPKRRFVKDFAKKAKPLTALTRKNARFEWTQECDDAFSALKQHLVSAPILASPDFYKPFIVDTDASDVCIGGVLSQVQDGLERVISYYSRSLSPAEQRYCGHRRPEFLLRTDHSALQFLMKMKNPSSQYARWLLRLATYNFKIEHRPGARHGNADSLSRRPCDQCGKTDTASEPPTVLVVRQADPEGLSPIPALSLDEIRKSQRADPTLASLVLDMQRGTKPDRLGLQRLTREQRTLYSDWPCLEFRDGVLYRNWTRSEGLGQQLQLLLPCKCARPSRVEDGCETCIRTKSGRRQPRAPLQPSVVGFPNDRVAMDIVGPLPKSSAGNKYILVASDYFTKWVEIFPMEDETAESVAKCFYKGWICVHGPPQSLHTDQGRNFDSVLELVAFDTEGNSVPTASYLQEMEDIVAKFQELMPNDE